VKQLQSGDGNLDGAVQKGLPLKQALAACFRAVALLVDFIFLLLKKKS
jgi:hypothetical protein